MDLKRLTNTNYANIGRILAFFLAFIGILALRANHYLPFISDDALISLRYAKRLLEGQGLTWTDGRPVEGYSNLLWLLIISAFGAVHVDLIAASRILGFLCMSAIIFTIVIWYSRSKQFISNWPAMVVGLLFFSLATPSAVWTIGGLEQPLYAAALTASIPFLWLAFQPDGYNTKYSLIASFILGLMCLTRPDGPLFAIAAFFAIVVNRFLSKRNGSWSIIMTLLLFPVIFTIAQLTFRFSYYGEFIPNTALVKISPSFYHFSEGLIYVFRGLKALFPFSVLAIISLGILLSKKKNREQSILLTSLLVFWSLYIIFIGGDVFPAFRHFLPVICVFTFAIIEGIKELWKYLNHKKLSFQVAVGLFIGVLFVPFLFLQFTHTEFKRVREERWEWDGKVIGQVLKEAFSKQRPLLAVTAAGCLPYWSELPCLDMLGLNDYYLPRHKTNMIGLGPLGHELGDTAYVLEQRPDIICFHTGIDPVFSIGEQLDTTREFWELYTPVKIRGTTPYNFTALLYFLKNSEKIGIQEEANRIIVPAYLLNAYPHTIASLYNGRLAITVDVNHPAGIFFSGTIDQHWEIEVQSPDTHMIKSHVKSKGQQVLVELTTKSTDPLPVEAVVLR